MPERTFVEDEYLLYVEMNSNLERATQLALSGNCDEAKEVAAQTEGLLPMLKSPELHENVRANLAGVLIDVGVDTNDVTLVAYGTAMAEKVLNCGIPEVAGPWAYYNAGNGHAGTWALTRSESSARGELAESHFLARERFEAVTGNFASVDRGLLCQSLVNLGNNYDSVGRHFDALVCYDRALLLEPQMPEALGNKAITLLHLSIFIPTYHHRYLVESRVLLEQALTVDLPSSTRRSFEANLEYVNSVIALHDEFELERVKKAISKRKFAQFSREFCLKHDLYLTPRSSFHNQNDVVAADDLYFWSMYARSDDRGKFERCQQFMNDIKESFVAARHLLLLSQYPSSTTDIADIGVDVYLTPDYACYGIYPQLMKMAFKNAIDLLDKVAFFVRDYLGVKISVRATDFARLWADEKTPFILRQELREANNPYIFALFDLALESKREGQVKRLYSTRHSLTHRAVVLHEWGTSSQGPEGIERESVASFLTECIKSLQLARRAILYLVLLLTYEERKNLSHKSAKFYMPYPNRKVERGAKWRPPG